MRECITREAALAALRKYNQEPFHLQHALTVEVARYHKFICFHEFSLLFLLP